MLKGAPPMVDPDTCVTARYVVAVDDYDKAHPVAGTPRAGPAPALSRSEVVTLAILAQWAAFPSERAFYRYAQAHLRPALPPLPRRSQYNRLLRRVHDWLVAVGQWLADQVVEAGCAYEVLDGLGVATRSVHRQGTGWLYGEADVGRCSRLGWYHGLHLLTVVSPEGLVTGYGTAPAATAEQVVAETLLACRQRPVGSGLSRACRRSAIRWPRASTWPIPALKVGSGSPAGAGTTAPGCSRRPNGTSPIRWIGRPLCAMPIPAGGNSSRRSMTRSSTPSAWPTNGRIRCPAFAPA